MGKRNRIAFVFPGQGSQYVGMGRELCEEFPVAEKTFAEAEEVLGFPLRRMCFCGPEEELRLTENAQPAILTLSVAALRVLQSEQSLEPACAAGHSLGEYSALVGVGALTFRDAVRIVRDRGRLMQQAVPAGQGAMAAVLGLGVSDLEAVCGEAAQGEVVSVAGLNGGGQIVIAGTREAVLRAMELAKARGAKRAVELPVSAPFHCPLMQPAADGLSRLLDGIPVNHFSVSVISNVEAAPNLDPDRIKPLLVDQVVKPVRWEESVKRMATLGCDRILEIGPGKVLGGLIRRISRQMAVDNLEGPEDLKKLQAES